MMDVQQVLYLDNGRFRLDWDAGRGWYRVTPLDLPAVAHSTITDECCVYDNKATGLMNALK